MKPDNVQTPERLDARLDKFSPPHHPCPVCGKETKEHHEGTRICSNRECRQISEG
jgi:hypothetical protein